MTPAPTPTPSLAYIALGSNLGDSEEELRKATLAISHLPQSRIRAASGLYQTQPIDSSGNDYLNAVIALETALAPVVLLLALQTVENAAGRERPYINAPRTLDLDILLYGDLQLTTSQLTLPHPRMWQRAFVLMPLHEIAPRLVPDQALKSVAHQALKRLAQKTLMP